MKRLLSTLFLATLVTLQIWGNEQDTVAVSNARKTAEYFQQKQYRMVEYYGNKALADTRLYDIDPQLYYATCQYLISVAFDNGDYKKGIDQITAALEQSAKETDPELKVFEARYLSQMGMGQMRLGRIEEGIRSCDESYRKFEALLVDDSKWDSGYMWYRSVGEAVQHFAICDIQTALAWLPRMDQTYKKAVSAPDIPADMGDYCLSKLELTKAEVYMKAGNQAEAEQHFKAYQQTDVARSGEDWVSPQQYYEYAERWDKLLAIYDRWDSLCIANGWPKNTEYQQMLGMKFYAELENGRNDLALQTARRIVENMASVDSLTRSDDASQLAVIYETQKKEAKIAEQEAIMARQQLVAVIIAFVLVAVFFVVYTLYRRRAAHRLAEVKAAKERIESELRIARDIQQSMVPQVFPERDDIDLYALMTPAREVGGDLYDYILDADRLYFCLGDVSGKGVPASLFMAQTIRLFRTFAKQGMMPAQIATRINGELTEGNDSGMFVTMFIGLLDLPTGHLDYCNAGHNPPVLGGGDQRGTFLEVNPNAPIGLWEGLDYEGEQIETVKGRALFVYTDGLNEAENIRQEQLGDDRMLEIIRSTAYKSCRQVIERLEQEVEKHRDGAEPNDDLTMMCLYIKSEEAVPDDERGYKPRVIGQK